MIGQALENTQRGSLQARIHKYLTFRFGVNLLGFGLLAMYQMGLERGERETFHFLYAVLGVYTLVGLASLVAAHFRDLGRWFVASQVTIDFVVSALLTGATGGVLSIFCPLLFVSLFSACTVLRWRGMLIYAALATTFLAVTTLGYTLRYLPTESPRLRWMLHRQQMSFISTYLIGVGIALHIVALLGSQLSTGLLRIQSLQTEILENIGEGLIATDKEGRILQINNEARRLLEIDVRRNLTGLKLSEALGNPCFEPLLRVMGSDGRTRTELTVELPSKTHRQLEVKLSTIKDDGGESRCAIGLFSDLALRKEVEAAEGRIRQLEELYQMALGIAHEIRNPLASIRGCIQELVRMDARDAACDRLAEIVCRESDRLDHIIEEFLCFTRKQPRPSRPVDLTEAIDAATILLRNHSKYEGRQIDWRAPSEPFWVLGDCERIQQIVLNLGLNALESTTPGTGRVALSLGRRESVSQSDSNSGGDTAVPGVEILIEDNGDGIPQADLDRIFTPFVTSRKGGTGLGLAIVHRFVHDHGGAIRVDSKVGEGARFSVWFPLFAQDSQSPSAEKPLSPVARIESVAAVSSPGFVQGSAC